MEKAEFDRFADEYSALHVRNIALSGEAPDYFAEYKIRDLARECPRGSGTDGTAMTVLDFGAGVGTSVPYMRKYFPNADLTCLDVSMRSLEIGKSRFPGLARFMPFDGSAIPFQDGEFDVAFAACVFHHIEHDEHVGLFQELRRILRNDGRVMIYEHNPLNPLTVHAVKTCAFDENARLIRAGAMLRSLSAAGFSSVKLRYRVFFPHALRWLRPLESSLTWLPLGAQYYALGYK